EFRRVLFRSVRHVYRYVIPRQGHDLALTRNERPRAVLVIASVASPQVVVHQFTAIVELQGKPVPALLPGRKRTAAPFAVHPRETGNLMRLARNGEFSVGFQPRQRIVVTRIATFG